MKLLLKILFTLIFIFSSTCLHATEKDQTTTSFPKLSLFTRDVQTPIENDLWKLLSESIYQVLYQYPSTLAVDLCDIGSIEGNNYVIQTSEIKYQVRFPEVPSIVKTFLGEFAFCAIKDKQYSFGIADLRNPGVQIIYTDAYNELVQRIKPDPTKLGDSLIMDEKGVIRVKEFNSEKKIFTYLIFTKNSFCYFSGVGMSDTEFKNFLNQKK